ncbi:hypothetical protein [Psychrobacter sp. 72-O-c]|uniref:hypothetical protein n=1 Tax=Psychrobacter sp. 72-O-c TaxID=2774125 RepID=UPI00191B7890|nr:hypothetical protein [Psychrobacter sp. 72-O-c]
MSLIIQSNLLNQSSNSQASKSNSKKWIGVSTILIIAALAFSATGCGTTQEFKPTTSVIVGAHKSL